MCVCATFKKIGLKTGGGFEQPFYVIDYLQQVMHKERMKERKRKKKEKRKKNERKK